MFQTNVEQIETHTSCSVTIFSRKLCFYDIKWKNVGRAEQATGNNMARANYMLDT
jgi:hypothetical protein